MLPAFLAALGPLLAKGATAVGGGLAKGATAVGGGLGKIGTTLGGTTSKAFAGKGALSSLGNGGMTALSGLSSLKDKLNLGNAGDDGDKQENPTLARMKAAAGMNLGYNQDDDMLDPASLQVRLGLGR